MYTIEYVYGQIATIRHMEETVIFFLKKNIVEKNPGMFYGV